MRCADITIANERLQSKVYAPQCLALVAFEQREIFIMPYLLWHETSLFVPQFSLTSFRTGYGYYSNTIVNWTLCIESGQTTIKI